jgi:hypothetical protein
MRSVGLAAFAFLALLGCGSSDDTDDATTGVSGSGGDTDDATTGVSGSGGATSDAGSGGATSDAGSGEARSEAGATKADASSPPSGEALPVGDIAGWRQIFTDDFTTDVPIGSFPSAVSSTWSAYQDGWTDTSKNGRYEPSKVVSVAGGMMDLFIHTEEGVHMVSAPVPKLPGAVGTGGGLLYGRYAVRFRADPIRGYKTAWLLWPDSEQWPRDGEIDYPEGNLDATIAGYMHRMNGTSGGDQDAYETQTTYTSWHTAVLEWTAASCKFILDGNVVGTSTSRIPSTPMHWVIQTETALDGTVPADAVEGHVVIDWVAVWVPS